MKIEAIWPNRKNICTVNPISKNHSWQIPRDCTKQVVIYRNLLLQQTATPQIDSPEGYQSRVGMKVNLVFRFCIICNEPTSKYGLYNIKLYKHIIYIWWYMDCKPHPSTCAQWRDQWHSFKSRLTPSPHPIVPVTQVSICSSKNVKWYASWWYTYPSEEYESQLGWLCPYIMEK